MAERLPIGIKPQTCSILLMKKFIIRFLIMVLLFGGGGLYRLNELNKIPVSVENYSTYNLLEIYALGIVMSVLAYPLYPEIAIEHFSLMKEDKGERQSDFFMKSKVVQKAIKNYRQPSMLVWDAQDYLVGNTEARVALAFNGAILTKEGKKISVRVPIKYPRNSLVELLPGIKVQEGLFWVLQEEGWYHTGEMTWTHTLP
jgi:hypothetical protein